MRLPHLVRTAAVLLGAAAVSGCAHDYAVEARDTPVHVWITAPESAARGEHVTALVYVGGHKVVEGTVAFAPGKPTVVLPSVTLKAGPTRVSAVLFDGAVSADATIDVEGESWVQILVRGRAASIRSSDEQPSPLQR